MTCEQIQESISQFIDGELDHDSGSGVFAHLGICGECRAFFQSALRIRSELLTAPALHVPEELDSTVRQLWERREAPPVRRARLAGLWSRRFAVPIPAVAAVVLLVVSLTVSTLLMMSRTSQTPQTAGRDGYAITLPTVEIQGTYPEAQKSVQ